jgi:hypothetical protein
MTMRNEYLLKAALSPETASMKLVTSPDIDSKRIIAWLG